jgi:tetratricopeptide (TPR) repeat protein
MSQFCLITGIIVFSLLLGCSSKFKIESEPSEAQVYVINSESEERKAIGKTPLEMPTEEFENKVKSDSGEDFFTLEVAKDGFVSRKFTLPYSGTGTLMNALNIKLKQGENKEEQVAEAEELIKKLFLAQKFALSSQHERALIELDKLIEKYPKFSRALSMKGSIYFAQKKYSESLKWYEEAIKVDPQMEETIKMAAKVRKLTGSRNPAGGK